MKSLSLLFAAIAMCNASFGHTAGLDGAWSCTRLIENQIESRCDGTRLVVSGSRYIMVFSDATLESQIVRSGADGAIELVPSTGANRGKRYVGTALISADILVVSYSEALSTTQSTANAPLPLRVTTWKRESDLSNAVARTSFSNSVGMNMRLILPGTFVKGATQYEYARQDEGQQRVTLQRPFYMAAHEVTVGQFAEFVNAMQQLDPNWKTEAERDGSSYAKGGQSTIGIGSARWVSDVNWKNPGFPQTSRHPVVFVSWNDAVAFCSWLSKREAKSYRLPTEAEWEYVARAGTTTAYWWGDDPAGGAGKANVVDASYERLYPGKQIPVGFDDGFAHTAPVGSFEPNAWGFYDVVGNVFEWVLDFWSVPTTVEAVNPTGPQSGTEKVAKGGGFGNRLDHNRSAFRFRDPPSARHAGLGFRVLLDVANTINP